MPRRVTQVADKVSQFVSYEVVDVMFIFFVDFCVIFFW